MLRLRKRLLPLLRAASHPATVEPSSSSLHLRALLLSTSPSPTPFSIEDYLITTCGLAPAQALKASKKLSHLKSATNPDAVLTLLSGVGLSRPDIADVVAADPLLLCSRADNVAPRLAALRERIGLSVPEISRFLLVGARALRSCDIAPRLEFWIPFFGSFDKLLQIVKGSMSILTTDLDKVAKPNIALLQECGLSVCDIAKISVPNASLLAFNPDRVKEFVLRADKLGVPRSSWAYRYAVGTVASLNESKVAARLEFLKGILGCSTEKLSVAVCKNPHILRFSNEKLRLKIEFLVTEVGLELEYIVERPKLFNFSIEKRLAPRHYVIKALQAKGLMKKGVGFFPIVCCGEKVFREMYIDHHKVALPGLPDAYAAICAGEMPPEVQL